MKKRRAVYPVFIKQAASDYLVYVPDLEIYTEGGDMADAISMARDAIGLKLLDYLDEKEGYPAASDQENALRKAKADADDLFDYSDGILTFVDVDVEAYRNKMRNRAVKKNCTIPFWLNEEAEKQGINFSKVLQDALIQNLNIG